MKCNAPGAAKRIARKHPGGCLKKLERRRELNKLNAELDKNELKRRRAELEAR
jgi:hypothetical protein